MASLEDLFDWLGPEPGQQYETIRAGLIRVFISNGFDDAEDLADLTIDRVLKKLPEIRETYEGEKARYFYGVARNVMHEARRRKEIATDKLPEDLSPAPVRSDEYECLLKCLKLLLYERSELILDYYLYDGRDKVEHHRRMAEELGITVGALRTRAHHIRRDLEKCVLQCVGSILKKTKSGSESIVKEATAVR